MRPKFFREIGDAAILDAAIFAGGVVAALSFAQGEVGLIEVYQGDVGRTHEDSFEKGWPVLTGQDLLMDRTSYGQVGRLKRG